MSWSQKVEAQAQGCADRVLSEHLVTQIPFAWVMGVIPRWNLRDQPSGRQWKGRELDGSLSKLPSCPFSYQEQDSLQDDVFFLGNQECMWACRQEMGEPPSFRGQQLFQGKLNSDGPGPGGHFRKQVCPVSHHLLSIPPLSPTLLCYAFLSWADFSQSYTQALPLDHTRGNPLLTITHFQRLQEIVFKNLGQRHIFYQNIL